MPRKIQQDGLEWLEYDLLADIPHLKHAAFSRHGGHSQDAFKSLNVSYSGGDNPAHVEANLARIQTVLQQKTKSSLDLVRVRQQHGKDIVHAKTPLDPNEPPIADALITQTPGLALMINCADCQATIFYDPINRAIANVHSGWRGSVLNIYAETIQRMQKDFGTKPANLLVCISPSLGPQDAEFVHYRNELPESFWPFQVKPFYFDFWAISEFQLRNAGVLPHHIEVARISTYSNTQDYFSYRKEKITGRQAVCVTLLKP